MSEREAISSKRMGRDVGKSLLTILFLLLGLTLIWVSSLPAVWLYGVLGARSASLPYWGFAVIVCLLAFAYTYAAGLLVLRFLLPVPKEGVYPMDARGVVNRDSAIVMLNIVLTRLRYNPPWNQMIMSAIVTTPPLGPLYRRFFGPHTQSTTFGDTLRLMDPSLVYIGRDAQFGYDACITCHHFDNRGLVVKRVVVEDHAMVGGLSFLMTGVHVQHHGVVAAASVVKPFTVIKPYEFWAGNPARKIKDLPRPEADENEGEYEARALHLADLEQEEEQAASY